MLFGTMVCSIYLDSVDSKHVQYSGVHDLRNRVGNPRRAVRRSGGHGVERARIVTVQPRRVVRLALGKPPAVSTARRLFPFGFGWQSFTRPFGISHRIIPSYLYHRIIIARRIL